MASRLAHLIRSNAVLLVAVLVSLGVGTAWAATTAPKNSVVSKSIKNGQVRKKDIGKGAVNAKKVKPNSLTGAQINESSLDSSVLQRRIADACPSGQALTAVGSNGKITCTSTGGPPSGSAGGDLSGTYPSPQIAAGAVGTAKLTDLAVITAKLAEHAVTGDKVAHDTLTGANIDESSFSTAPSGAAGGALAGSYPNPTLAVSGGPCANGQALVGISAQAALTCAPGIYSDSSANVSAGPSPLAALTTGTDNTAVGKNALAADTTGVRNSALGRGALAANTTGTDNTALGVAALQQSTAASLNTAVGAIALTSNTTGTENTALGATALLSNTTGDRNAALGRGALFFNSTGFENVALGSTALFNNTTGDSNTAVGEGALSSNTTEFRSTAIGHSALRMSTGGTNTAIGYGAGANLTTGRGNVYVASPGGAAGESNTIRIGQAGGQSRAFVAGIRGTTTGNADAIPVLIDSAGQLGTLSSSRRYKEDIHAMGTASDPIMGLRPVTFRYRRRSETREYGLIAEQVARRMPSLVVRGADGRPETVQYQDLPVLLLNELQKERRHREALSDRVRRQQVQIDWLMQRTGG